MEPNERIRDRRKELGLSAEDLAKKINVSPATMYRYENGDIKKLPIAILNPIAKALYTTPAYIMGWEDDDIVNTEELTKSQQELFDAIIQLDDEKIRLAIRILHSILDDKE